LNSLKREKGDTKEFRRLVLCSFGKGRRETQKEFRHLVLVEFFLAKGEERHKIIQAVSPCRILFGKREKKMKKMNSTLLFSMKEQGLETRKLRKLLAKEEEEEE